VKPVYQKELSGEAVCRPGSVSSVAGSGIASSQYQFTPPSAGILMDGGNVHQFYRPHHQPHDITYQHKSISPSLHPADARQDLPMPSALIGGETHSIRQPIMSSNAQPSIGYNTGAQPYMVMPSVSQTNMYALQPRYPTSIINNPNSPQFATGPPMFPSHPGGFNPSISTINYNSGYPNMHVNLGGAPPGSVVIPDPLHPAYIHNPVSANLPTSMLPGSPHVNMVNPNLGLIQQHPAASLGHQRTIMGGGTAGGMINPVSVSNLAVNHGGIPMGASYPTLHSINSGAAPPHGQLPLQQQQQILLNQVPGGAPNLQPHVNLNSAPVQNLQGLNPTPAPSLQGVGLNPTPSMQGVSLNPTPAPSLAGSLHESVHLDDVVSVHGSEVGQ